ncbi:hypothetical protein [Sorangium sp. So ce887]|uniref:hypothetical protein n=1 Tax=unclassified Sorangium TaxID=2621164 RepID=UPI003F5E7060
MIRDKARRISATIASFLASSTGRQAELANVAATAEWLGFLKSRCDGVNDCLDLDDEALKRECESELAAIDSELATFKNEFASAPAFFRPQTIDTDPAVPMLDASADAWRSQKIVWRVGCFDLDHPKKWLNEEQSEAILHIISRLKIYESFTWSQLDRVSEQNHRWEDWSKWEEPSRDRLRYLCLDDQEQWYQLDISKLGRLFGYRDSNVFNVVWWDRDHEVYKTKRKRASQR